MLTGTIQKRGVMWGTACLICWIFVPMAQGFVDTDGDQIDDAWEAIYFRAPEDCDSAEDFDGDGFSNLQEYENGTDPAAYVIPLKHGWNLVSIARVPNDHSIGGIFGDYVLGHAWTWEDGRYQVADTVLPLRGHWVYCPVDYVLSINIREGTVNHAPLAESLSVSAEQNLPLAVTLTATDAEGDGLTFQIVSEPFHGTLTGTPPELTYTPATNFYGTDTFTFSASDEGLTSFPATVEITVQKTGISGTWVGPWQDTDFPMWEEGTPLQSGFFIAQVVQSGQNVEVSFLPDGVFGGLYGTLNGSVDPLNSTMRATRNFVGILGGQGIMEMDGTLHEDRIEGTYHYDDGLESWRGGLEIRPAGQPQNVAGE